MDPPSYDQSIAEDKHLEDGVLYYQVYLTKPWNSVPSCTFTIMNSDGKCIEQTTHDLDFMSELSKNHLLKRCMTQFNNDMTGIYSIIDDVVKHFGPMHLMYGTINSRIDWPSNIPYNTLNLTFTKGSPQKWSVEKTMRIIHIPVEYVPSGSGGTNWLYGHYTLYY